MGDPLEKLNTFIQWEDRRIYGDGAPSARIECQVLGVYLADSV